MELVYWAIIAGLAGSLLGMKGYGKAGLLLMQFAGNIFGAGIGWVFLFKRERKRNRELQDSNCIRSLKNQSTRCYLNLLAGAVFMGLIATAVIGTEQRVWYLILVVQFLANLIGAATVHFVQNKFTNREEH